MVKKIKIILIEDNEADREIIKTQLFKGNKQQFQIYELENALNIRSKLEKFSPDIILLDYFIPGNDPKKTILEIKNFNNKTPVIIITGRDDDEIADHACNIGAKDCLSKFFITSKSLSKFIIEALKEEA